jgi:creatinase
VFVDVIFVDFVGMFWLTVGWLGAGGYRDHVILVITEDGNYNITGFPYGPEHLIVK